VQKKSLDYISSFHTNDRHDLYAFTRNSGLPRSTFNRDHADLKFFAVFMAVSLILGMGFAWL